MIHEYCDNSEYSIGILTIWNDSLLLDRLLLTIVYIEIASLGMPCIQILKNSKILIRGV
jgi:hypothetical protein